MRYKLPKRFREGLIDFWGDPGDGPEGVGNGVGGPSGTGDGPGNSDGGASPADGPEGLGNGVGGPSGTGSGPNGGGAEAGTEAGGYHGIQSEVADNSKGWMDKALDVLANTAKRAATFGLTQNKAAQALEGLLNIAGYEVDFKDTVQGFLDKGFETSEATSKAAESLSDMIGKSDMSESDKDEAYKNLQDAITPEASKDPNSFEFFMEQFKNTDEGKAILQDMYNGQNEYTSTNLFNEQKDVVTQQTGLLDSLIDQSQTGTGLFSPISFKIAGQEVSFVPKALRAQAAQEADLGQQKVANAMGLFGSGLTLDKLAQDASQFERSDQNVDQQREANEPGWLDYLKGIGSLFKW